jgi:hypothetical protein
MESFVSERLPSEPVYDLPTWLEHNYPQHDTQARSPLYHWVSWMREHLPLDQQRLYLAFDQYMQSDRHRSAIVAQANYVRHGGVYVCAFCVLGCTVLAVGPYTPTM